MPKHKLHFALVFSWAAILSLALLIVGAEAVTAIPAL